MSPCTHTTHPTYPLSAERLSRCVLISFVCDLMSGCPGPGQKLYILHHQPDGSSVPPPERCSDPPSPNTSREQQQTEAQALPPALHMPSVHQSSMSCICVGFVPHLPDSSYTFYQFGKALGMTELYSNQLLALEEGWTRVCFTFMSAFLYVVQH